MRKWNSGPAAFVTPLSEVGEIEDELRRLRQDNQHIEDYLASQRMIDLLSQISDRPNAAETIAAEKEKQAALGEISQDDIDAYLQRKQELERRLREAKRSSRRGCRSFARGPRTVMNSQK